LRSIASLREPITELCADSHTIKNKQSGGKTAALHLLRKKKSAFYEYSC
jgi:hypothetical protein